MTAPVPVVRDRSGEPAAAFDVELARIEQAPAAAEGWATVEKVARAMYEADGGRYWHVLSVRRSYEKLAAAAVLALDSPDAAAVRRVLALAEDYDRAAAEAEEEGADCLGPDEREYFRRVAAAGHSAADRIRAAITGPTPEPDPPFPVGTRVDVFEVPGGYVVAHAGHLDDDTARALADAARPAIEETP